MYRLLTVILILFFAVNLSAQEKPEEKRSFGISFKGFVKTDVMYDSRQTVAAREGHFFLYPTPENLDPNGEDINAKPNFNMLSIQTRLTGVITAPDFLGAKTSGVIEGAFFGHSNPDVNGFRLRHAIVKLDWETTTLLIGQYWNPMFITEVFPDVISFNTGSPFQPFARNPQIRLIKKFDDVQLTFVAASQRDFSSKGPGSTTPVEVSSSYLRNSVVPILNFNLKYVTPEVTAGAGVDYKTLTPRTETTAGYKTDNSISSVSAMAFAKFNFENLVLKFEGIYGSNLTDLLMLGGYAVKSTAPVTAEEEYTNIKSFTAWGEVIYGQDLQFGLFAGYSKNLGADDNITGVYYANGDNIDNLLRITPRIQYKEGNTLFAVEYDYTSAAYGTANNANKGKVENTTTAANSRLLFAAYLFF